VRSPVPRLADGFPGERLAVLPPAVLRRARALPVCRDLSVTHIGRFDQARGHYVVRPAGRPEHVLIVCLAGAGTVAIGHTSYRLHRGHGIVLPPRHAHRYAADMDNPWTIFWFHFVGRRAADYVAAIGAGAGHPQFWVQDIERLAHAFEECYPYVLGGYGDAELIGLSTGFARLLGLCRNLQRSINQRIRQTEDRVLRSLTLMRENLDRTLSLEHIARHAGLSVPHFAAMFRRQLHCSPIEFHIRLRMQRACELLESSDHTAAEIADALGYRDPLYFSRLFRRKIGQPPTAYRAANVHR